MSSPQLELPASVEFSILGKPAIRGTGTLASDGGKMLLTTATRFPFSSGTSSRRLLQAQIEGIPALIIATVIVKTHQPALRVSEVRYGSDLVEPQYSSVRADFEHAQSVASYRMQDDGPRRADNEPLIAPALDDVRAMQIRYLLENGAMELVPVHAESWSTFGTHLAAFQDLLTFAADSPAGCASITALEEGGTHVTIYTTRPLPPFRKPEREPIEHVVRLGGEHAQAVISGWWTAREKLRPVTQILAGVRYQTSYVEGDLILLAAALERFARHEHKIQRTPLLTPRQLVPIRESLNRLKDLDNEQQEFVKRALRNKSPAPTLQHYLDALLNSLGDDIVDQTRISRDEWCSHFRWARNDIAHEGAPNNEAGEKYVNDAESRAVRDATWMLLSLSLLRKWEVPEQAVLRAAERLGNRYGTHRRTTTIFR